MIIKSGSVERKTKALRLTYASKFLVLDWVNLSIYENDESVCDEKPAETVIPVKTICDAFYLMSNWGDTMLHIDTPGDKKFQLKCNGRRDAEEWSFAILSVRNKYLRTLGVPISKLTCGSSRRNVKESNCHDAAKSGEDKESEAEPPIANQNPVSSPIPIPNASESSSSKDGRSSIYNSLVHTGSLIALNISNAASQLHAQSSGSVNGSMLHTVGGILGNVLSGTFEKDFQAQMDAILTEKQVSAIYKLENVLLNQGLEASSLFESVPGSLNQNGIGRHVMNAFFKCLYSDDIRCSKLSKRERNEVSKLFGQGLAIWCCSISSGAGSQNSCGSGEENPEAKSNILLCNVLESILVREFQKSCDFTAAGEDSSPVAHNTPFRGDHPESLMITSYVKIICQTSGFLSKLLTPLLMTVSSDPNRVYAHTATVALKRDKSDKVVSEVEGGVLGNVLNTTLPTADVHAKVKDVVSKGTAADNEVVAAPAAVASVNRSGVSSIDEEFVKNARNMLFERLGQMDCDVDLPHTLRVLTRLLKKITVGKNFTFSSSLGGDLAAIELAEFAEKPEVGIYYSSLTALLFLRLICPAIIEPVQWGVFHDIWTSHSSRNGCVDINGTTIVSAIDLGNNAHENQKCAADHDFNYHVGSPALLLIVMAHVLNNSCEMLHAEEEKPRSSSVNIIPKSVGSTVSSAATNLFATLRSFSAADDNKIPCGTSPSKPSGLISGLMHATSSLNENQYPAMTEVDQSGATAAEIEEEYVMEHALYDMWSGSNEDLPPLVNALQNVVEEIPFSKAMELFELYKRNSALMPEDSIHTAGNASDSNSPSNESSLGQLFISNNNSNSKVLRKALTEMAKSVQKLVNQSISMNSNLKAAAATDRAAGFDTVDDEEMLKILRSFCIQLGEAA